MILADSNFWLALSVSGHVFHHAAREWFGSQSVEHSVVFCRATQQSLLRLLTTETVMRAQGSRPMTNTEAWAHYRQLRSSRLVDFVPEPTDIESSWRRFSDRKSASPKIWMDAYLAAFAVAGNYNFLSADRAFSQYEGLNVIILEKA